MATEQCGNEYDHHNHMGEISCLRFNPAVDLFALALWDNKISIYRYDQSQVHVAKNNIMYLYASYYIY